MVPADPCRFLRLARDGECLLAAFHSAWRTTAVVAGRLVCQPPRPRVWLVRRRTGHAILRVERAEDLRQLMEDIRLHPGAAHPPGWLRREMEEEGEELSLAGSLPAAEWDNHLAAGIVQHAMPVLFLPHTAKEPLVPPGHLALEWIGIALAGEATDSPATGGSLRTARPDQAAWVRERMARLRERLRHFPADYEFFVMRTVRELLPCCRRLVGILAPSGRREAEQLNFGLRPLQPRPAWRCLGVEALGWHGYGFECPGGQ